MKTLLILISLISLINSYAKKGDGSHGGDPIEVFAEKFPKEEVLTRAIEIAKSSLERSQYNDLFNKEMLKELESLERNENILYLDKDVVLFPEFSNYAYIASVGALTQLKIGSNIYLTKQVLDYPAEKLSRVLLQELPHHIFKGKLATNEAFINQLGVYLSDEQYSHEYDLIIHSQFRYHLSHEPKLICTFKENKKSVIVNYSSNNSDSYKHIFNKIPSMGQFREMALNPSYSVRADWVILDGNFRALYSGKHREVLPLSHSRTKKKEVGHYIGFRKGGKIFTRKDNIAIDFKFTQSRKEMRLELKTKKGKKSSIIERADCLSM